MDTSVGRTAALSGWVKGVDRGVRAFARWDQRVGVDGDDRLRSGWLGAAISDENATSFPRSARRSMVLLTAWGDTRGVTPNQRSERTAGITAPNSTPRGHCPSMSADRRAAHGHQSSSRT
jgi:hypothetical protein